MPLVTGLTGTAFSVAYLFMDNYLSFIQLCQLNIFILSAIGVILGFFLRKLLIDSNTDFATGLYNKRYFSHRLALEMNKLSRNSRELTLLFLDIDSFKELNDTFGHVYADKVLWETASLLKSTFTDPKITIARWGGDEFAVLLPGITLLQANNFIQKFNQIVFDHFHGQISISIGTASTNKKIDPVRFIEASDLDLYNNKMSAISSNKIKTTWPSL